MLFKTKFYQVEITFMTTENVAKAYIGEMEELIVSVLGEKTPQEIADFSGVGLDRATELCMIREMVKLNHLLQQRREQVSAPSARVAELKSYSVRFPVGTRKVANG